MFKKHQQYPLAYYLEEVLKIWQYFYICYFKNYFKSSTTFLNLLFNRIKKELEDDLARVAATKQKLAEQAAIKQEEALRIITETQVKTLLVFLFEESFKTHLFIV